MSAYVPVLVRCGMQGFYRHVVIFIIGVFSFYYMCSIWSVQQLHGKLLVSMNYVVTLTVVLSLLLLGYRSNRASTLLSCSCSLIPMGGNICRVYVLPATLVLPGPISYIQIIITLNVATNVATLLVVIPFQIHYCKLKFLLCIYNV